MHDRIRKIEAAADFNKKTAEGNRKDMSKEAYRTWARKALKEIIRPEFFTMISSNISELPDDDDNRIRFGRVLDAILQLTEDENPTPNMGKKIDEIFGTHLPSILRYDPTSLFVSQSEIIFINMLIGSELKRCQ